MVERKVRVKNVAGLHLRPAEQLCQQAMEFESTIKLCFRERIFNAKSLLSILSACVQQDDEVLLVCEGSDEEEAIERLVKSLEEMNKV